MLTISKEETLQDLVIFHDHHIIMRPKMHRHARTRKSTATFKWKGPKTLLKTVVTLTLCVLVFKAWDHFFPGYLINSSPITKIKGKKSGLDRPEGIAFAPSGLLIAAVNANANTVCFYTRSDTEGSAFETTPSFIIQGATSKLDYPHDASFSPDGNHLAIANRYGNSITIFKKAEGGLFYDPTPFQVIQGDGSKLENPNAVKYAPTGNILGVANSKGNRITLYRYQGDNYEMAPYQIIEDSPDILNIPDGLAFSSTAELLAVTSHANNSVVFYQLIPDSQNLYTSKPVEILKGKSTNFCFTHSLCFHPSDEYLAVSNAAGKKTLNIFKKTSNTFPRYSKVPEQALEIYNPKTIHMQTQYPEEGGVKGLAFSRDGKYLGLCASDIAKPDRTIMIYRVANAP